ncbi:hypothetical protein BJ742DRAFT_769874 [Cladochytrium replicatum]|nr:hypothetical protein BJ742DRAFT_769874 [Cladochytrium replicatum]
MTDTASIVGIFLGALVGVALVMVVARLSAALLNRNRHVGTSSKHAESMTMAESGRPSLSISRPSSPNNNAPAWKRSVSFSRSHPNGSLVDADVAPADVDKIEKSPTQPLDIQQAKTKPNKSMMGKVVDRMLQLPFTLPRTLARRPPLPGLVVSDHEYDLQMMSRSTVEAKHPENWAASLEAELLSISPGSSREGHSSSGTSATAVDNAPYEIHVHRPGRHPPTDVPGNPGTQELVSDSASFDDGLESISGSEYDDRSSFRGTPKQSPARFSTNSVTPTARQRRPPPRSATTAPTPPAQVVVPVYQYAGSSQQQGVSVIKYSQQPGMVVDQPDTNQQAWVAISQQQQPQLLVPLVPTQAQQAYVQSQVGPYFAMNVSPPPRDSHDL